MASLTFKKITINSFAGIDKENPVLIYFEDKKGKNIVKLSGDQGVGKSSVVHALLYNAAHSFEFSLDTFVNTKDKTFNEEIEFDLGDKKYRIKATKSKFDLQRLFKDGDDERWISENSPKTLVKELLNVGYSPMSLKGADGKAQMAWFYSMVQPSPEVLEKETKLKDSLKTAKESRTGANREYDRLKKFLEATDVYNNWEESEKKFAEAKDATVLRLAYETLQKEVEILNRSEGELVRINDAITKSGYRIEELELELAEARKLLTEQEDRKQKAVQYLEDNDFKRAEAKKVGDEYFNLSNFLAAQKEWLEVKKKKSEMDDFETVVQKLDGQKDDLTQKLRDLASEIAPDVAGLEVVSEDSIDGKEMGIYVDGKTVAMLSESELWNFYMKLCKAKNVNMVVIENVNSLGTLSVEMINDLAKSGIYIFATEMKRGQKELKIEIIDELK